MSLPARWLTHIGEAVKRVGPRFDEPLTQLEELYTLAMVVLAKAAASPQAPESPAEDPPPAEASYYMLDGHVPVPVSPDVWKEWNAGTTVVVASDWSGTVEVQTTFDGDAYASGRFAVRRTLREMSGDAAAHDPTGLFVTCVTDRGSGYRYTYSPTWEDAEATHRAVYAAVCGTKR